VHMIISSRLSSHFCTVCDQKLGRSLGTSGMPVLLNVLYHVSIKPSCFVLLCWWRMCDYPQKSPPFV